MSKWRSLTSYVYNNMGDAIFKGEFMGEIHPPIASQSACGGSAAGGIPASFQKPHKYLVVQAFRL
jgi:hypothetical protein